MNIRKLFPLLIIIYYLLVVTSCYSVFSGGTGGRVVDAESTSSPKSGIADVDVYAYTSESDRDSDFSSWDSSARFAPASNYYAHTTTGADGSFTLSKIIWKETKPDFGRDGDNSKVWLLFYHENYGLVKGETLIVSDSMSNTVYQELTSVKKTTVLNLTFNDVSTGAAATTPVYVEVSVSQKGLNGSDSEKKYTATITGAGAISVSYPRYLSEDDKSNQVENTPSVTISYTQSADSITWKACYNADNEDKNYAFIEKPNFTKKINGSTYNITLYGKKTELYVPTINGRYDSTSSADGLGKPEDDGIKITMKCRGSGADFSIDCGEVTTSSNAIGTGGTQSHGNFSGLGNGITWKDEKYTGKFATTEVQIYAAGTLKKTMEVRSDTANYNVQIN